MTVGAVTTGSPFGTYQTVSPSSTIAGPSSRYQIGLPLLNGTTYVGWSLVKYSAGNGWFVLDMYDSGKSSERSWFDLQNGVVGTKDPLIIDHGMINYGDGWWLCWASSNATNVSGGLSLEVPTGDGVLASNSGDVVLVAGSQFNRSDLGGMVNNPDTNSSYVPTTSAAAVYLPRTGNHVYNGTAWVNEGLLLESEPRTNLMVYSEDFTDASWTKQLCTVTTFAGSSPVGTGAAKTITGTGTGKPAIYSVISVTGGSTYSWSFFAKAGTTDWASLGTYDGALDVRQYYDLTNGVLGSPQNGTFLSAGIEDYGDGWYLCWATRAVDGAATTARHQINQATADLTLASGDTLTLHATALQLEAGSTPSSYIPNAGATAGVIRAAETLTVAAADMPWPTVVETTGTELVTNGTFDTDIAGWTLLGDGSISYDASGGIDVTSTSGNVFAYQAFTTVIGAYYKASGVLVVDGGNDRFKVGTTAGSGGELISITNSSSSARERYFTATSTTTYISVGSYTGQTCVWDDLSIKEINPLAVSIQMDGQMTYADDAGFHHQYVWQLDGANRVRGYVNTQVGYVGRQTIAQEVGNIEDTVALTGAYSPSINVPFNIAARHGSTFINGAVDGTALTANTTPTALPDLSAADFKIGSNFMGNLGKLRVWADDLGETGIAEASE
jgi:hypothetical protein